MEYKFYLSREVNVYFNIRKDESVIQVSLRGGECNLLMLLMVKTIITTSLIVSVTIVDSYSIYLLTILRLSLARDKQMMGSLMNQHNPIRS